MSSRRVVLADDHPPTRHGVRMALEGHGFTVCAEAATADAAVDAVREHSPDVALLDVDMPGSGIAAAERIAELSPETSVVMLTVSTSDNDLFAALQAGAVGYLLKDTNPNRLPYALEGVLEGEAAMPRTLVSKLIREYQGKQRRRRLPFLQARGIELTEREWQVLEMLREELTTKQMAERLEISPVTVRRHVSALIEKLGVADRGEAVRVFDDG
ncbi:MAG TPA: response regulator transcription factor [Solirubrobacteraceae bacterium]|nr:response regulator transcription factor [Solirubrobacteraceae bacterium]